MLIHCRFSVDTVCPVDCKAVKIEVLVRSNTVIFAEYLLSVASDLTEDAITQEDFTEGFKSKLDASVTVETLGVHTGVMIHVEC